MNEQSSSHQIVAVRVRPLIQREIKAKSPVVWRTTDNEVLRLERNESLDTQNFVFDKVIGPDGNNWDVYNAVAKDIVQGVIQGINGAIFAYGQTSSGKTYTMLGAPNQPGLVEYGIKEIFQLREKAADRQFIISMSYLEIYNEEIRDLLSGTSSMKMRESMKGDLYVEDCRQVLLQSPEDLFEYMAAGDKLRHVGATNMNEMSSRSHAIATIFIESKLVDDSEDAAVLVSQLNLVDLAGSEKADQTGAVGQRKKEAAYINTSLLNLSVCMSKLADKSKHIPYRDSKLTRLLQKSIGGNSRTAIVANVTPASVEETIGTLRFASRAKKVSTKPVVNEVVDGGTVMRRLERRVKELELELKEKKHLDDAARSKLVEEILHSQSTHEAQKQRRMTWCAGPGRQPGAPLIDLGLDSIADKDDNIYGSVSGVKRPMSSENVNIGRRSKRSLLDRPFSITEEYPDLVTSPVNTEAVPDTQTEYVEQLRIASAEQQQTVARLEMRVTELESERDVLAKDLELSNQNVASHDAISLEYDALKIEHAMLLEKYSNQTSATNIATVSPVAVRRGSDATLELLQVKISSLESDKTALMQELERAQESLEDYALVSSELDILKMERIEFSSKEDQLIELRQEMNVAQLKIQEMETERSRQTASESQSAEAESTAKELSKTHSQLALEGTVEKENVEELKVSLGTATNELERLKTENHGLLSQLKSTEEELQGLRSVKFEESLETSVLTAKLDQVHKSIEALTEEHVKQTVTCESDAPNLPSNTSATQTTPRPIVDVEVLNLYKEELEDCRKGIDLRDAQLAGLERGYDRVTEEYEQLIEFSNLEKEVYSCRTPGQIKEKKIRVEILQMQSHYNKALVELRTELKLLQESADRLAAENYRLRCRLGEAPSARKPMVLNPCLAGFPDNDVMTEEIPEGCSPDTTFSPATTLVPLSPCPTPQQPNFSAMETAGFSSTRRPTADVGINTDMGMTWFEIDDTILGITKTGVAASRQSLDDTSDITSFAMPTPGRGLNSTLTSDIQSQVQGLAEGLQMAYTRLQEQQSRHEKDQQELEELKKAVQRDEVSVASCPKICGSCEAPVMDCDHFDFVPTSDWREAQEELERELAGKQKRIEELEGRQAELEVNRVELEARRDELAAKLGAVESEHSAQLETIKAEQEFLVQAAKQHRMNLSVVSEESKEPSDTGPPIEDITAAHVNELSNLRRTHNEEVEELRASHQVELKATSQGYDQRIVDLERKFADLSATKEEGHKQERDRLQEESANCIAAMVAKHSIEISLKDKEFQQSLEESNALQRLQLDEAKEASSQLFKTLEQTLSDQHKKDIREKQDEFDRMITELAHTHQMQLEKLQEESSNSCAEMMSRHSSELATREEEYKRSLDSAEANLAAQTQAESQRLSKMQESCDRKREDALRELQETHDSKRNLLEAALEAVQLELELLKSNDASENSTSESQASTSHATSNDMAAQHTVPEETHLSMQEKLDEKEAEMDHFMEEVLKDRRILAKKYQDSKDRIEVLESQIGDLMKGENLKQFREQITKEVKQEVSLQLVFAEKAKRELSKVEKRANVLQKRLDNPEGQVKEARDLELRWRQESERYHDELVQIDHHIQTFGEEYFGVGDWYFHNLADRIRAYMPEELKVPAAKAMAEHNANPIGGFHSLPPKKVDDKGELCPHLRKRQHARIIALESAKAGMECEISRLKKENKQISKLQVELHELKQEHYNLKEEYKKLEDLFNRTEQELLAARERSVGEISASDIAAPFKKRSNLFPPATELNIQMKIKGRITNSEEMTKLPACQQSPADSLVHGLELQESVYPLQSVVSKAVCPALPLPSPPPLSTKTSLKRRVIVPNHPARTADFGLEFEKYNLSRKNTELSETLDKLQDKYIILRERCNRLQNSSKSAVETSSVTPAPVTTSVSADGADHVGILHEDLNLEENTEECKTQ